MSIEFERVDTPTVMSGLVVRWRLAGDERAEISASRDGVAICGPWPILSADGVQRFSEQLRLAGVQADHLAHFGFLERQHALDDAMLRNRLNDLMLAGDD